MRPINVTIQNISYIEEIPETNFKIRGHKLLGQTLQVTIEGKRTEDSPIQALWVEETKRLFLVGESSKGKKSTFKVSINLQDMGRCVKIFKLTTENATYHEKREKLIMSVDTRSKTVTPTYISKKKAPVHQIPLQILEEGQDIVLKDFEILSYKVMNSTLMLFVEEWVLDESAPSQIQAYWNETHKKLYLSGGMRDYLLGMKEREVWLHIDLSSLGKKVKLEVCALRRSTIAPKVEDDLFTFTIPDPMDVSLIRKPQEPS